MSRRRISPDRAAPSRVSVRLDCGCLDVSLNGDTPKPFIRYRSCKVHGAPEPGPDVAALERLLAQGTKTPPVPGAMDPQNRIDRRLLLQRYGSMENILPPELDAQRPRCNCCDWSQA